MQALEKLGLKKDPHMGFPEKEKLKRFLFILGAEGVCMEVWEGDGVGMVAGRRYGRNNERENLMGDGIWGLGRTWVPENLQEPIRMPQKRLLAIVEMVPEIRLVTIIIAIREYSSSN